MILFIILVVLLILAFIGAKYFDEYDHPFLWFLFAAYIVCFGAIHFIILLCNLCTLSPFERKELQIKYEELSKNKHNEYLIEDIIEWNKEIRFGKEFQHDKWIGIYIPNIYDDFEEIDVNN